MSFVNGLACRECGEAYEIGPVHVCELCFGPLEVRYDYDKIASTISRKKIEERPPNVWRYRELLPIDGEPRTGFYSGFTPLIKARRLADALRVKELYVKDDSVNHPTFSYKDRVVSVALTKAIEMGFDTVACASTGNLANSVSAHAARCGLRCFVFIPDNLERGKVVGSGIYNPTTVAISGNYDDVNRLCTEIADKYQWAFANINLRPFYTEGAKTYGFEVAEQLGWKLPAHIVVPTAGGTILPKVAKGFEELVRVGLVKDSPYKIYCAQAAGCSPVVDAIHRESDLIEPVKPHTIAKSIAIGNPADGYYVLKAVRKSGGWGDKASDEEIVEAIHLLAETEGIFTEPAGGTTLAVTKKLIDKGIIPRDEPIVVSVTGNGYKTLEAVADSVPAPLGIPAKLSAFDELLESIGGHKARRASTA